VVIFPMFSRVPQCSWTCVIPLFLCQLDRYFDVALLFFPVLGIGSVLVHLCTMVWNNDYALMILSLSSLIKFVFNCLGLYGFG
jgi:hypothetical protein